MSPLLGANLVRDLDKLLPLLPSLAALESPASSSDTFLPALPSGASLLDDLAVVARSHVAGVGLADARSDQQGCSVDQDELEEWSVIRQLVVKDLGEDLCILFGLLPTRHCVQGVGAQAKVAGMHLEVLNFELALARLLDHPAKSVAGTANLVELLLAADDECLFETGHAQCLRKGWAKVSSADADDPGLEDILDGVSQGPKVVEDGPPRELLANGRDVTHACVEHWGKQEGVVGGRVSLDQCVRSDGADDGRLGLHAVDQVGAARLGGAGLVSMLGHHEKCRGKDGRSGADVERVVTVTTSPNNVTLLTGQY